MTAKRRLYVIWYNMKRRCYDQTTQNYPSYGGRGVRVCDRWHDFNNFLADMGPSHREGLSLDRIDGDKGYEPGNCRWATKKEQANNRSSQFLPRELTLYGKTQSVAAWAKEFGLSTAVIRVRLGRGLSVKEALTRPVQKRTSLKSWLAKELG